MPLAAAVPTDPQPVPLAALADESTELAAHIAAATYRFLGAAREKVRVAHALEDYLLMIANHGTASHVERLARGYRKVKRA